MFKWSQFFLFASLFSNLVYANPTEIYCTIRETGSGLSCQWLSGKERRVMTADDIPLFVDAGQAVAYITLKSRRGFERTMMIDSGAPQYKKLNETKRTAAISEINRAKSEFFSEIEKRAIKISDELDAIAGAVELVKFDPSVANDKFKRDNYDMTKELDGFKKNREKLCTTTPAFEQLTKANAKMQETLSSILYAFQAPDSCMTGFKVFKDKDGAIDLRQLDDVGKKFAESCKKK